MTSVKAIIFDMEGVIVNTEHLWDKVAEVFLQRRGFLYDKDVLKPLMMGKTLEEGVKIWQQHYGFEGDVNKQAEERRMIVRDVFGNEVTFIPGFTEFFKTVKKKYKTAIATSSEREFIDRFDKRLQLSSLFDNHIYSIADIGYISKPNPDIFLYAAKNLNIDPEFCVGIEDSPHGVTAINSAGMKSIAITTSTSRKKLSNANLIVDSFEEINLETL